ncbi:hypothetical protein FRC11_001357, partial [Ceratobasidium sp. 423]
SGPLWQVAEGRPRGSSHQTSICSRFPDSVFMESSIYKRRSWPLQRPNSQGHPPGEYSALRIAK